MSVESPTEPQFDRRQEDANVIKVIKDLDVISRAMGAVKRNLSSLWPITAALVGIIFMLGQFWNEYKEESINGTLAVKQLRKDFNARTDQLTAILAEQVNANKLLNQRIDQIDRRFDRLEDRINK
jgi:hypothetical protein